MRVFPAVWLCGWIGAVVSMAPPASAAIFVVTAVADTDDPNDGYVSLREAINAGNANASLDVIRFDIDIHGRLSPDDDRDP